MTTKQTEKTEPFEDHNAFLETTLIEEYLREKGYSMEDQILRHSSIILCGIYSKKRFGFKPGIFISLI